MSTSYSLRIEEHFFSAIKGEYYHHNHYNHAFVLDCLLESVALEQYDEDEVLTKKKKKDVH